MQVSVDVEIASTKDRVWAAITDIENCANFIEGILDLEVLHKPGDNLVGLKWKETRTLFGKEATETMWITEAVANKYYCTRAESHGSIYLTKLALNAAGNNTLLTMTFSGEGQTFLVKIIGSIMGVFMKGSMKKLLIKDLQDIKQHVERGNT